jgi:hypothetical protein
MRRFETRLRHLEAAQEPLWGHQEGLAALLDAARQLPRPQPWDLPALEDRTAPTGLARLLAEAEQAALAQMADPMARLAQYHAWTMSPPPPEDPA